MSNAVEKLRNWLLQKELQGVVLSHEASVAWLFGGRYHIAIATELACAQVLVTLDTVEVLVNNIEVQRLQDEEALVADRVLVYPWHEEMIKNKWLSNWLKNDRIVEESKVKEEIQALRLVFSESQRHELEDLGQSVATALYQTSIGLRPEMTEYEAAGFLSAECLARGVEPIVNLVAGPKRARLYRHVLPTFEPIGSYAVLSVSGRKKGMVVSATRMVHFGPLDPTLHERYLAVLKVEAALLRATVVGTRLGDVLSAGIQAYSSQGFPDEWTHHHQGGIAGYLPREVRAIPNHSLQLVPSMMLAWNPTISGVKAEDSVLLRNDGIDVLTSDEAFPRITVEDDEFTVRLPDWLSL